MNEGPALPRRVAPVALLVVLALAGLAPAIGGLRLASSDAAPVEHWRSTVDALPDGATVLVGFDPDLGTYAEIRPTVRVAIADLLARDARLAFVSLTPEGRALLLAELARLERATANPTRLLDLGFVPGAEAALVSLAAGPTVDPGVDGSLPRAIASEGAAAFDAVLVVGGNDLGPRSWVEQFLPRVGPLALMAIAPTVLLPELQPYVASGQVDGLLATPRDGAAYRAAVELGPLDRLREVAEPSALAVLVGLAVALLALGQAWVARMERSVRGTGREGHEQA